MEDIGNGIKISIQDGVTEDPTIIPTGKGISCIGKVFVARPIGTPVITAIFGIDTPIGCPDCSITSILETAVT